MSKTPFMPLWVSDFLGDTLDLDAQEIGAYMLLIMAQWNRDGKSLPDDQKKLKRVARCGRTWPRIWASISHYFETDENGVFSPKCRFVYASVAAKREVNRHNAALGGKAKALKTNKPPLANASQSLERNAAKPKPKPDYDDDVEAREGKNGVEILSPREQVLVAMGHDKSGATATGRMVGNPSDMLELGRWQNDLGLSLQEVIGVIEGIRAGSNKPPPNVFKYFNQPMQEFAGMKNAPALMPTNGGNNGNGNYRGATNRPRSGSETDDLIAIAARARPAQGGNRN